MRGHRLGSTDITKFYTQTSTVKKELKETRRASKVKPQPVVKPSKMASEVSPRVLRQQQAPKTELDYEIERLKAEIQQEKQMKDMLEESSEDLEKTIGEMQEKSETAGEEDNEWKTRFETQQQMNNQLEKQILLLRDKLEQMKIPSRDGKPGNKLKTYNGLSDTEIRKLMRQMERDKLTLEGQLRDLEWRLDNESKAYHKINEERKQYITELNQANAVIDNTKNPSLSDFCHSEHFKFYSSFCILHFYRHIIKSMKRGNNTLLSLIRGSSIFGLPDNQRILDPKKGPVKKTAAVRKLPKLNSSEQSPR
ncbi:coiled-coil domain-containing protein 169-like [Actinia tenebrosa]|uniref:Coiled-coil domain-containing protein 169-like n=1 Tax=Actinia tenebrosa TaxID=6105 RepID=A0A6P8HK46_ACTTE|nr:coiled-coil domain-containing protein 169-like [Actinia tenebrosa]